MSKKKMLQAFFSRTHTKIRGPRYLKRTLSAVSSSNPFCVSFHASSNSFHKITEAAQKTTSQLFIKIDFEKDVDHFAVDRKQLLSLVHQLYSAASSGNIYLDVNVLFPFSQLPPAVTVQEELASLPSSTPFIQNSPVFCNKVLVGGTFDHLHSGHKLLLTGAMLATKSELHVGVSHPQMLVNKSNPDLIQPLETRMEAVKSFLDQLNPNIVNLPFVLYDHFGPTVGFSGTLSEVIGNR